MRNFWQWIKKNWNWLSYAFTFIGGVLWAAVGGAKRKAQAPAVDVETAKETIERSQVEAKETEKEVDEIIEAHKEMLRRKEERDEKAKTYFPGL